MARGAVVRAGVDLAGLGHRRLPVPRRRHGAKTGRPGLSWEATRDGTAQRSSGGFSSGNRADVRRAALIAALELLQAEAKPG